MKIRLFTTILLLVLLVILTGNAQATPPSPLDQQALIYVTLSSSDDLSRFASTKLPMYVGLDEGLLTGANQAGQQALLESGLKFQVLDPDLLPGAYYLAETRSNRPAPNFALFGQALLNTSNGVLLRMDPAQVDALTQAGAELRAVTLTPKPLPTAQNEAIFPNQITPDPIIQGMIDQITTTQVYTYDRQLAGELPVWVDNAWYTILTRNTYSGTPIQKATHFVGQHMLNDLGMDVEYHVWNNDTNPNVIGEIPGLTNPDDIFIIGAHIDDVTGAPGADDNGSGSVATLIAADILSKYQWGCTLRFAFWTGEEQGLLGSEAYAQRAHNSGVNILGYLNLDMIAWNTINSPAGIDLLYNASMPPTLDLANLFADVVDAYNINLIPDIRTDLGGGSDHSSFWNYGYTSILSIEDQGDFNPYYHSPQDTPAHTDPTFFTNFVKASIATYAHMSGCLIPSGVGHLAGHVTAASGGAPIEAATVTADNGQGHTYSATTNPSGYYTRTLIADTYTVTASAYSYLPSTISGVSITTDTVTTQDFALALAPTYIVSGTVTESGTGLPLHAEINFVSSPVTVWSDPSTGFYQAELPESSYTMHVRADLHRPQTRNVTINHDQTQNFELDPLPCILLVDDDNNAPDTTPYYTAALDALGYDFDVYDVGGGSNGPSLTTLQGYDMVLWYSGDSYGGSAGPNPTDEITLTTYLDNGGKFFLDSQDYLYDFGLTTFGQNYLGISSYSNDTGDATSIVGLNGDPIGNGLGPFALTYPPGFSDYGDIVSPKPDASVAFRAVNNSNNLDIDKDGVSWRTVFFGTSWVPIYNSNPLNGQAVLQRTIDWFGGCQSETGLLDGHVTDADTGDPLEGVIVTASPGKASIQAITDPTGYYSMTLPAGSYTVTATLDGYVPLAQTASITPEETTTLDFALQTVCEPVSGLDFTWMPPVPFSGVLITFTTTASGTQPIDFLWDFGDTFTSTGSTVTHTYVSPDIYMVTSSAMNACGTELLNKDITVLQHLQKFFLPVINK